MLALGIASLMPGSHLYHTLLLITVFKSPLFSWFSQEEMLVSKDFKDSLHNFLSVALNLQWSVCVSNLQCWLRTFQRYGAGPNAIVAGLCPN